MAHGSLNVLTCISDSLGSSIFFLIKYLRPYHEENTRCRPIMEIKHRLAGVVIEWGDHLGIKTYPSVQFFYFIFNFRELFSSYNDAIHRSEFILSEKICPMENSLLSTNGIFNIHPRKVYITILYTIFHSVPFAHIIEVLEKDGIKDFQNKMKVQMRFL